MSLRLASLRPKRTQSDPTGEKQTPGTGRGTKPDRSPTDRSFPLRAALAGRVVALAATAAVAAILIVPSAGARAATPAGFFGLNYAFKDITNGDILMLKKSGATTVRWTMNWSNIEPSSGSWKWSAADKVVGGLAAQGIRVLPVMWGSPSWVASSVITAPVATQKQRDAWSGYLRAAIKRYGPGGNYWSGAYRTQHPGKAALPVNTWQIWNEANLKSAMTPTTPATYAKLLTLSHTVIQQTDPKAKVMFAGLLSHPPNGATAWTFVRDVDQQPGARTAFDIMASNAYSPSVSGMLDDLDHIRQTMAANGQGPKPLWALAVGGHRLPDVVEVVEHPRNGGRVGVRGHDVECGPGAGLLVDVAEEGPRGGSIRRVAQKARERHLRLRVRLLDHRVREGQQLRVGGVGGGGHRTLQVGFVPDLPGAYRQRRLAGMLCPVGTAPVVPAGAVAPDRRPQESAPGISLLLGGARPRGRRARDPARRAPHHRQNAGPLGGEAADHL